MGFNVLSNRTILGFYGTDCSGSTPFLMAQEQVPIEIQPSFPEEMLLALHQLKIFPKEPRGMGAAGEFLGLLTVLETRV